jgi:uncharacterized repeat protein (TIGR01451 family)
MGRKFLVILIAALIAVAAIAVPPAAGTKIKNQAAATYTDNTGVSRTILSNQVITNVLPIYSVVVTPDVIEQPGAAGQTLYFQFRIDNLANIQDSFTTELVFDNVSSTFVPISPEVYYDENGNGIVDPGEEPWDLNIVIPSNDFRYAIVKYRIPSATTAGATATVWLNVESVADPENAFDYGNAANARVYNDAVLTLFKSATPDQVSAGDTVTYVLSGSNVGNQTANSIVLTDFLAPSLEFVGFENPVPATMGTSHDPATNKVTLTISSLNAGVSFSIKIVVKVKADTLAGMVENFATITYDTATSGTVTRTSNTSTIMVGGPGYETAMVFIGPKDNPEAVGPTDRSTETGVAGTLVSFTNTLKNSGLSTDILNITVSDVLPAELTGVVAIAFFTESLTPLTDSNDDGMQDTGPLAPGQTFDAVVKIFVPSTYTTPGASITATIKTVSSISGAVFDTTVDVVYPILIPNVQIGNATGLATDTLVNKDPVNMDGNPGEFVYFPLDVVNLGGGADTFSLSAVTPSGWTVRFYIDANGDGVLDPEEMIPITNTGLIGPDSGKRIIARVAIPEGTLYTGTPVDVRFYATSLSNPTISDYQHNTITVNKVYSITLQPSRNGSASPNTHIDYEHTLTNTGNVAADVKLYVESSRGWAYVFEYMGTVVPLDSTFTLNPGQSITGILRLFIPGEPLGIVDVTTLEAVVQEDTSVTSTIIDVTIVVSANVRITKSVDKLEAKPGEILVYTVKYEDIGSEHVSNFFIYDTIPFFTKLDPSILDGGYTPLPTGVSFDYGVTWVTFTGTIDFTKVTNLRWEFGTLEAGESGQVSFPVIIDGY